MKNDIHIETERLILRSGRVEDAQILHVAVNEVWDELQLWMSWAFEGNQKIEAQKTFLTDGKQTPILGFDKATGAFVIATGYHPHNERSVETGYWVAKDFRRQGLAYEAMQAVLSHIFAHNVSEAIYICHAEGNTPSENLIKKLGFTKTGVTENDHVRCSDGQRLSTHHYIMERQPV